MIAINYRRNKKIDENYNLEFEGITFHVIRRKVRYPRIEFKSTGFLLIIPRYTDPINVLQNNKQSILKKCLKIKSQIAAAKILSIVQRNENEFNELIKYYIEKYSGILKVKHKGIKFRKMIRRWGSCRNSGVITLNSYLRFVPEKLLAYIVYHELVHLKVRPHNKKFKAIIAEQFPNYRALDKELVLYGFRLLS